MGLGGLWPGSTALGTAPSCIVHTTHRALRRAGGQLAFVLLEVARGGKKLGSDVEGCITAAGVAALTLLALYLLTRDVAQLAGVPRA